MLPAPAFGVAALPLESSPEERSRRRAFGETVALALFRRGACEYRRVGTKCPTTQAAPLRQRLRAATTCLPLRGLALTNRRNLLNTHRFQCLLNRTHDIAHLIRIDRADAPDPERFYLR